MDQPKKLLKFKVQVDKKLALYLKKKINDASQHGTITAQLLEQITDFTLRGGKRVRAALLYYSYLAHGGQERSKALYASMSMELAESYLLIHDDIMDDDSVRRGGPTVHKYFEDQQRDKLLGESLAILAGDLAAAYSVDILLNSGFDQQTINSAVKLLNDTYVLECFGQTLDLNTCPIEKMSFDDIMNIPRLKTAPYTFDLPVKLGAILAGKRMNEVIKLEKYTYPLGIVYQLQDDILSTFGDEKKTGKSSSSDIKEGKRTLLAYYALKDANASDQKFLRSVLGNRKASATDIKKVKEIFESSGALAKTQTYAQSLTSSPLDFIDKSNLVGEGKDFLIEIANIILTRKY